ncbi:hypothetical protein TNCV_3716041 [Trichonephila clavipes]|nr:hypothetical protein TNCV_3716041 [Trichonephila clavipes]
MSVIGDGPCNFEPQSNKEDDISRSLSPNINSTPMGGLRGSKFNTHQPRYTMDIQWQWRNVHPRSPNRVGGADHVILNPSQVIRYNTKASTLFASILLPRILSLASFNIHQSFYTVGLQYYHVSNSQLDNAWHEFETMTTRDEAHFWLNGYVNKQNCRIWSEANPQVYVETPLHPEKLTVWCALWAGGILLQKR